MENSSVPSSYSVDTSALQARNTEDAIYFNFSYAALKLLGKNLYSNAANAISELVANSIDANAPEVYVYIDMSDKKHAIIEIIDNGSGMSYSDLAEKYVWIGRNKRVDEELNDNNRSAVMGRKGIGKLAALYLSNKYYILTKQTTDLEVNQWKVDISAYNDADFPKLDRISTPIKLINEGLWQSFGQGTAIKLENVDLRRNGEKRIDALCRAFADFYLTDAIKTKIKVAVRTVDTKEVAFEQVQKKIAYKNFYAAFDNSRLNIAAQMSKTIAFTWASKYPSIANKPREVQMLDSRDFSPVTSGKKAFLKEDGSWVEKEYHLVGWIAIHSTIEQKNAIINDANFLRNNVYQPNRLRLYVRNKLAVEDYFSISPSTQTMANYIEGEISFDILDDDDLPDIATSSRQDFLDDERIELLKSIVDPILIALFALRNKVGKAITDENNQYEENLRLEEENKRKAEEIARKQAEVEKEEAERAKATAEEKYENARKDAEKYHAQSNTIFNAVTEDQKSFSAKTHLVKTNALTIRNGVTTLAKKVGFDKYKELGAISVATDKILSALKYSALAKFNIEDEFITEDLFVFCDEYLLNVLSKQYFNIAFRTEINGSHRIRFNPQYISLLLDNLAANSSKSNSSEFVAEMKKVDSSAIITVYDNGDGFKNVDMTKIFEFGFSNTGGTGIGLYNVRAVAEKMNGRIIAENNSPHGARFIITLP